MSDLISRSEVNDVIDELEVYTCGKPNTMKVEVSVLQLKRFINKLKNIQNAYSVDKVVEELQEFLINYGVPEKSNVHQRIIKIVKQGGVADDVCEWKQTSTAKYKTGCGYKLEEYFDTKACYCKQCGKKIKVVE